MGEYSKCKQLHCEKYLLFRFNIEIYAMKVNSFGVKLMKNNK